MLKKFITFLIFILFISLNITPVYAVTTNCGAALLFELNTQTTLYESKANQKMYPASITKIMTAALALELGNLDDKITVDDDTPYEIYGSHIALEPGEVLTLKDLLYALILPSANDAASVIAKHYSGDIESFVKLMNEKAKEIGATNTHFANPHGLHDDNHYTTAADLAKIVTYAMKNETFREIIKTPRYEIPATNKKEPRAIITTNNLLLNTSPSYILVNNKWVTREYEGAAGVKTGYTPEAGNCLISYVEKNGIELVAIVLNGTGTDVYTDTHNLLNYGFDNFEVKNMIKANEFVQDLDVLENSEKLPLVTKNNVSIIVEKGTTPDIKTDVTMFDISLPIKKGDSLGKLEYKIDNKVVGSTDIISTKSVASIKNTNMSNKKNDDSKLPTWLKIIIAVLIAVLTLRIYNKIRVYVIKQKRKKRRKKMRQEGL